MDTVEYQNVVILDKIKKIKDKINNSGYFLDKRKAKEIDLKMMKLLQSEISNSNDTFLSLLEGEKEKDKDDIKDILVIYYYALYNDNLELLKRLLSIGFSFKENHDYFELFPLDNRFLKYFSLEQFLFILENCYDEVSRFYHELFVDEERTLDTLEENSLKEKIHLIHDDLDQNGNNKLSDEAKEDLLDELNCTIGKLNKNMVPRYNEEEREKLTLEFIKIMSINPFICKNERGSSKYTYFLDPLIIKVFGSNLLLQCNDVQKKLIDGNYWRLDVLQRLKQIFIKYPDFDRCIYFYDGILDFFTDDELYHLDDRQVYVYGEAVREGVVDRVKHLYELGYDFSSNCGVINKKLMELFDDKELMLLSDDAVKTILSLINSDWIIRRYNGKSNLSKSVRKVARKDIVMQKVKKIIG